MTEIVCDQLDKEKRSVRIYQNRTEVEERKEAQMSLGLLLLFLAEGTKPDSGERPGIPSLLSWRLSFSIFLLFTKSQS